MIGSREKLFDCNLKLLVESEKAIKFTDDDMRIFWLPKSQIEMEERRDGTYDVTMPEWLAKEKELL